MADGERCKARLWDGWRHCGCSKPATRDGFCGTHHPEAAARRKAKREARVQAQMAKWDAAGKRRELAQRMQSLTAALAESHPDRHYELSQEARSIMRALAALEQGVGDG